MPNTQAIGVAFADPEFQSVNVTGALTAGSVSSASVTASGDLFIKSATVAATGSAQSNAAAVTSGFTLVSAADGTKGVVLPAASAGLVCIIKNNAAAALKIYPASGDAINALSPDAAYSITNVTSTILVAYNSTTWYSVPLVAS
jgi:hypothetical protein